MQIKHTVSLFSDDLNSVICNDKYRLIYLKDTTNKGRLKTVPEIEETDIFRRP
ncbi:hypothetical protein ACMYUL_11625 [Neisseria sp. CP9]|uniref:hypothetical protein n=1 Tax=unclassified Neisseria TaxID=2623750 RepID=UPI003139A2FB